MSDPKVTLTDEEREQLNMVGWIHDERQAVVESIVAHRVAEALRDAQLVLLGHRLVDSDRPAKWRDEDHAYNNGIRRCTDWLGNRANSYDPTGQENEG